MKDELTVVVEKYRLEFVTNDKYRGLDLDFISFLEMSTSMSREACLELNNLANRQMGRIKNV